jgi:hypothetical protein
VACGLANGAAALTLDGPACRVFPNWPKGKRWKEAALTDEVAWKEVAAYYLSIRLARSSFRDQDRELDRLKQLDRGSLQYLMRLPEAEGN